MRRRKSCSPPPSTHSPPLFVILFVFKSNFQNQALALLFAPPLRVLAGTVIATMIFFVVIPLGRPPKRGLGKFLGWFCTVLGRDYYPVDFAIDKDAEFRNGKNYVFACVTLNPKP